MNLTRKDLHLQEWLMFMLKMASDACFPAFIHISLTKRKGPPMALCAHSLTTKTQHLESLKLPAVPKSYPLALAFDVTKGELNHFAFTFLKL